MLHCGGQTLLPPVPTIKHRPRITVQTSAGHVGALVIASQNLVSWEQRLLLCVDGQRWEQQGVWLWHSQADSGVGHTGFRPFIAITFSPSPNCRGLAGVRRGEAGGSDWGLHWTEGWKEEEERDEAGSRRWSLIRDWTAANLLAASAQLRNYWGDRINMHITVVHVCTSLIFTFHLFSNPTLLCIVFFHAIFKSLSLIHFLNFSPLVLPLFLLCLSKEQETAWEWDQHHLLYQQVAHLQRHAN